MENHPKLSQIKILWDFSMGVKNKFETAVINEPSVFEPLEGLLYFVFRLWFVLSFLLVVYQNYGVRLHFHFNAFHTG